MKPQQLDHGLYGRRDMQQRDSRCLAWQMLVKAQQCAHAGTVQEFHAPEIDGHGFNSRLPQLLALSLEVAGRDGIEARGFYDQVERLIYQFSLNDSGHSRSMSLRGTQAILKEAICEVPATF